MLRNNSISKLSDLDNFLMYLCRYGFQNYPRGPITGGLGNEIYRGGCTIFCRS